MIKAQSLIFVCALILCGSSSAEAQEKVERELYIDIDDSGASILRRAEKIIEAGDWALAIQLYDQILEDSKFASMLIKDPKSGAIIGLRGRVRELLLSLPAEGKHAYRLLRGVDARLALERGRLGDREAVLEVLERRPISLEAGEAATILAELALSDGDISHARRYASLAIGIYRGDLSAEVGGRAWRAALACEAIERRAEVYGALRSALEKSGRADQAEIVAFAEALYKVPQEAVASEGLPKISRNLWEHRFIETWGNRDLPSRVVPSLYEERVLAQNGNYAYALDLSSGKLQWKVALHERAEEFERAEDEARIFAGSGRAIFVHAGQEIRALELSSGREVWRMDQERIQRAFDSSSPHLVAQRLLIEGSRVYATAVTEGDNHEYHVLAMDAETGRLLWQTVACAIRGGASGRDSHLILAAGRLVLVPGDGVLVGLDAASGSFCWLREYPSSGMKLRDTLWDLSAESLRLGPSDSLALLTLNIENGELKSRQLRRPVPLVGYFRGHPIFLTPEGELRTGRGAAQVLAKLGKVEALISAPTRIGRRLALSFPGRAALVDLSTGATELRASWGEMGAGGIALAVDRVLCAGAQGIYCMSGAAAPKPDWLDKSEPKTNASFLIAQLSSQSWVEREAAAKALLALGSVAKAEIEAATRHPDAERAWRASELHWELGRAEQRARWSQLVKESWQQRVPGLLDRLTHANPRVRLEALVRLSESEEREVLALFVDLLKDGDPRVALTAAQVLYGRGSREGLAIFTAILEEGAEARQLEVLKSLDARKTRAGREEDLPLARLAAKSKHIAVRAQAMGLIVDLGDRDGLADLELGLKDPADEVRVAAVQGLGALGLSRAAPLLAPLLEDGNEFLRAEVIKSLSRLLPTEATGAALCRACLDKSPLNGLAAAEAVVKMARDRESWRFLPDAGLEKALEAKDAQVRRLVVEAFRERPVRPLSVLVRLAVDKDAAIRDDALERIFNQANSDQVDALVPLAESDDVDVQFAAVQIFEGLKTPRADPMLLRLLESEDEQVRRRAARTLKSSAHPRTVWLLIRQLPGAIQAQKLAEEALAELIKKEAAEPPAESDEAKKKALLEGSQVRRRAALATRRRTVLESLIREMRAEVEAPGAILALSDSAEPVREFAIKELAAIGGGRKGFEPGAAERGAALEVWRSWFLAHKTGKSFADLKAALASEAPAARIEAAKALRFAMQAEASAALVEALSRESLDWVARELDKELSWRSLKEQQMREAVTKDTALQRWREILPAELLMPVDSPRWGE